MGLDIGVDRPGGEVPEEELTVVGSGSEEVAEGVEREGIDRIVVGGLEGLKRGGGGRKRIPDLDRLVGRAGREARSIGAEGEGGDPLAVGTEGGCEGQGREIPKQEAGIAPSRREAATCRREGERVDILGVALE